MEQNIDRLIGLFLEAEETETSTELIIDSKTAYIIASRLQGEFEKDFLIEEEYEFENLLLNEGILGVAINCYDDGEVEYFLQPVLAKNGDTLGDDSTLEFYIHEDVIDEINTDKLNGEIIVLKEGSSECDCCECCLDCDCEDSEEDTTDELEEIFDDIANDLVDEINECIDEEDFCVHCAIKERLAEVYLMGLKKSHEQIIKGLTQSLVSMK